MITAVDSNVLIDVFTVDRTHGAASREAFRSCLAQGGLIACEVVWAEVAGSFPGPEEGTRDRGFYRSYFPELQILTPSPR